MGSLFQNLFGTPLKTATPSAQNTPLAEGIAGNIQTIQFMRNIAKSRGADPTMREFTTRIIGNLGSHNYGDESLAIGDFVKANIRYVRDPRDSEMIQDPVMLLKKLDSQGFASGDCDDMALLIATMLLTIGHDPYFRAIRYKDLTGNYNHIYVVDYDSNYPQPKQRIVLDAILKDRPIGSEVQHASGEEYII